MGALEVGPSPWAWRPSKKAEKQGEQQTGPNRPQKALGPQPRQAPVNPIQELLHWPKGELAHGAKTHLCNHKTCQEQGDRSWHSEVRSWEIGGAPGCGCGCRCRRESTVRDLGCRVRDRASGAASSEQVQPCSQGLRALWEKAWPFRSSDPLGSRPRV